MMFIQLTRCFSNCKILVNLSDISTILDKYGDYTTLILKVLREKFIPKS